MTQFNVERKPQSVERAQKTGFVCRLRSLLSRSFRDYPNLCSVCRGVFRRSGEDLQVAGYFYRLIVPYYVEKLRNNYFKMEPTGCPVCLLVYEAVSTEKSGLIVSNLGEEPGEVRVNFRVKAGRDGFHSLEIRSGRRQNKKTLAEFVSQIQGIRAFQLDSEKF